MPSTEDEIARIRHSGVMNPNIFKLDKLLNELNLANSDDFTSEIPDSLIDIVVLYLEGKAAERANTEAELKHEVEVKDKLLRDIERQKDMCEKARCQARYAAEKCVAQDEEQKQILMRDREVRVNLEKETQQERRKTEKFALEEKKARIEHERLTNLARKCTK
jgi:hypothetical protein